MATYDCAIVEFQGWASSMPQFEAELSQMLGGSIPNTVGETARHQVSLLIRIAPRRLWLLCGGQMPIVALDSELGCAVPLSESRVRLRLSGECLKDVLERCVAVDWETLGDWRAAQTSLHRIPVLLLRKSAVECDILVPRSFSKSLADWITDASAAYT